MNSTTPHTLPFSQLGHYEILSTLGRGGMGLVYLARDTRLEREVAIKCLRSELFEAHYIERFKREALLLAKLNHPNIVQIYDFVETPEQLALVMEYVEGQNLQQHLREHLAPFAQRMRWLTQIAQGLAVAHDSGIIHRDLKAENILIDKRGQAKISDLGIAKSQDFSATLTDHVTGSYCSMSPEQAMGEALDFKSDLFSFGILAYQLLCGAHPFGETENKLQLMQRIITHPPIAPSKNNPNIPAEITDLLGQLLSKDPAKRPDNTHWVAAQLETLSHLQLAHDFVSDDTQAIPFNPSITNSKTADHATFSQGHLSIDTSGHATFDTRFIRSDKQSRTALIQKLKKYWQGNQTSINLGALTLLILASAIVWQLQPKPPRYVAVLMPSFTASAMPESQQDFVKGAIHDAIQQSIIQLDDYYLIPRNEIADVNGDSETIRKATAADELITSSVQCQHEACSVVLSRLVANNDKPDSRLRVANTVNLDILADNYLSSVDIVKNGMGKIYSRKISDSLKNTSESDYASFLEINREYSQKGADEKLLEQLQKLITENKTDLPAIQSLYSDIALDLYHDTQNPDHLNKLETLLAQQSNASSITYLNNLFYLQIAQEKYSDAEISAKNILSATNSIFTYNELQGYLMMAKQEYLSAIDFYQKALTYRKTSNIYYYLSLAYWHYGNTQAATEYTYKTLDLSPSSIKAYSLQGIIYLIEGNAEKAKIAFEKVIAQKPEDPLNLSNIGICQLLLHNFEQAYSYFDAAYQLAPHNALFILNKADAKDLSGKQDEASKIYASLIAQLRDQAPTTDEMRYIAQSYAHLEQFSDALRVLKDLERIDANNIETIYTAALVHTLANNQESAFLYASDAITNGMSRHWFSFSWFDKLCANSNFITLMNKKGAPNRCPHE